MLFPILYTAQTEVAVFGGPVAQYFYDKVAQKELEKTVPKYRTTNFGKAGDGFCKQKKMKTGKPFLNVELCRRTD